MSDPVFKNLDADQAAEGASEIDSLCLNCREDGKTRFLFTKIPFFREVVIMSFECSSCGWKNNELQPAATIGEKGVSFTLKVDSLADLSREIVKTEWAQISIPEIEFEVSKQSGLITTIEGLIDRAIEGLQPAADESKDERLISFLAKLRDLKSGATKFTFSLKDPSGNSFVENPCAPNPDPKLEITYYTRSSEEDRLLGVVPAEGCLTETQALLSVDPEELIKGEVHELPTNCPSCNAPCTTRMKVTDIPHFKQVVIMATTCEACGSKTNEIKSGSGIEDHGIKLRVLIDKPEKLTLDLVRSDTCLIKVPELELELESTGQGRYTTVEGLIKGMKEQLSQANPFALGDSSRTDKLKTIIETLDEPIGLTLELDDPAGNSWVYQADHTEKYTRTWQQNEDLGLNDMKVDGYQGEQ